MKIKEAEEKTGLTRKAIRYYESAGLIRPGQADNGYKDYDDASIRRLLLIRKLRLLVLLVQCSLTAIFGIWKSRLKARALEKGVFLQMVMPAEAIVLFLLCAFTFAVAGQMILSRGWLIREAILRSGTDPAATAAAVLQGLCLLLYAALDLAMIILPFTSAMRSQAEFLTKETTPG